MIAQVKFSPIMKKEDYDKLSKLYDFGETTNRISVSDWPTELSIMSSSSYYEDEVTLITDDNGDKKYFYEEKEVSSYSVRKRPLADYVGITSDDKLQQLADIDALYEMTPTIKCTIEKVVPFKTGGSVQELEIAIKNLSDKINYISDRQFDFNAKCNVQVPGLGLLRIKTVDYVCDMCTEKLQDKLNKGWRIIAACPQPDQRRPDYILGLMDFDGEED